MSIAHTSGKVIAYGLLVATLAVPSATLAGQQDKYSGELAPGFNICEKKAADYSKNSADYRAAMSLCLNSAEQYWDGRLKKANQDYVKLISLQDQKQNAIDFQKAWLQYKEAGSKLILADGDPLQAVRARFFEVKETRRQAKLVANGIWEESKEELAPGFDMCIKKNATPIAGKSMAELRSDGAPCLDMARKYWNAMLDTNYDVYMNLHKDSPEKQENMQKFQNAWKQYRDAGYTLVCSTGGSVGGDTAAIFSVTETRRQARMLDSADSRW